MNLNKVAYKIILVIVLLIVVSVVIFKYTLVRKNTQKIAYQEISLYQHIFIAYEKGYFKEEGLNVELKSFASANQMMEAFLSDNIDVLGLTNTQVALTIEAKQSNQMKFINFLVWEKNAYPDYIIARKDAKIKTMKDLEGKKIGLHPGSAVRAFSEVVFKHFGLDLSKISTIELKPEIMQSSIIAGSVDAVYCMDPVATTLFLSGLCDTLISNPMQFIFPAPTPISGTALSTKIIKENPKIADRLIRAIDKAILYSRDPKNKDEIAGYIAKYTPIKKEQTLLMNPSVYWKFEEIQHERVQLLSEKFYELGVVDKKIDITSMIYQ